MEDSTWIWVIGAFLAVIIIIIIIIVIILWACCRNKKAYLGKQNTSTQRWENDKGKGNYERVPLRTSDTLDLHGFSVARARSRVKEFLKEKLEEQRWSCDGSTLKLKIITGKGKHSPGGQPVVKPAVEKYLSDNRYTYEVDRKNAGCLSVYLGQYDV